MNLKMFDRKRDTCSTPRAAADMINLECTSVDNGVSFLPKFCKPSGTPALL
jgi:hypothetical protein